MPKTPSISWVRRHLLQFSPSYWTLRQAAKRIRFVVYGVIYRAKTWVHAAWTSAGIVREMTWMVLGQGLVALALVLLLATVEKVLVIRLAFFTRLSLDEDMRFALMGTLLQMAGVFLGLYFTAVSVLASSGYSHVPSDVRALVIHEKVGNVYVRLLTLLAGVSLFIVARDTAGTPPGPLQYLLSVSLAFLVILSFNVLGKRAFHFFDASTLTKYLVDDLVKWVDSARLHGYGWLDPSFQAHYQRRAEDALVTYRNVTSLAVNEGSLQRESVRELATRLLVFLQVYSDKKPQVPTKSRWFKQAYSHKDWLVADETSIEIALRTGTALFPETVPQPLWLEYQIEAILLDVVRELGRRKEYVRIIETMESMCDTLDHMAAAFAVEEAIHLLRALRPDSDWSMSLGGLDFSREPDARAATTILAAFDGLGKGLTCIILGLSRRLDEMSVQSFANQVIMVNWRHGGSIYSTVLPREVIRQLEYVIERLDYEHRVEGARRSPDWYILQLAAAGFARFLTDAVDLLVKELREGFVTRIKQLLENKEHVLAAPMIQRGLEACGKADSHFRKIRSYVSELSTLRRVSDLPWPDLNWDAAFGEIASAREYLISAFAESSPALSMLPNTGPWPDYFGHSYTLLADECFKTLVSRNQDLFLRVFPQFFQVSFSAFERLRTRLAGVDIDRRFAFSTEPINDLLELSGYAIVFSELDGIDYGSVVRALWDRYLEGTQDVNAVMGLLDVLLQSRFQISGWTPRHQVRLFWKQQFEDELRGRGLLQDDLFGHFSHEGRVMPRHSSALIRAFIRGHYVYYDGLDAFVATYLSARPEAVTLRVGGKVEGLREALRKELSAKDEEE